MFKCFFDSDSLCWIEDHELLEEIKSFGVSIREESVQWLWFLLWEGFQQRPTFLSRNRVQIFLRRVTENIDNQFKLMFSFSSRKEGLASQQFGQNAANRPHVNYKQVETIQVMKNPKKQDLPEQSYSL